MDGVAGLGRLSWSSALNRMLLRSHPTRVCWERNFNGLVVLFVRRKVGQKNINSNQRDHDGQNKGQSKNHHGFFAHLRFVVLIVFLDRHVSSFGWITCFCIPGYPRK